MVLSVLILSGVGVCWGYFVREGTEGAYEEDEDVADIIEESL